MFILFEIASIVIPRCRPQWYNTNQKGECCDSINRFNPPNFVCLSPTRACVQRVGVSRSYSLFCSFLSILVELLANYLFTIYCRHYPSLHQHRSARAVCFLSAMRRVCFVANIPKLILDWLIVCCLISRGKYFAHIQNEN